jgi:hypothetical protein
MRTLAGQGIAWVGAGKDQSEAQAPLLRTVNGVRLAFLAYEGLHATMPATAQAAGTAWLEPEAAVKAIAAARRQADLVIVSVHWGVEYQSLPTVQQRALARQMATAGADLIIGHHPHVVQPVEWVQGQGREHPTLVAYSLGNFVFDMGFSPEVMQSALLVCEVSREGLLAFGLLPIQMAPWRVVPADAANARAVLSRLLLNMPGPLWQTVDAPASARAAAVWWFSPVQITALAPAALDAARTTALLRAWPPDAWAIRAIAPADPQAQRATVAIAEPAAWMAVDVGAPAARRGYLPAPTERLYLLEWLGRSWALLGRSRPLPYAASELVCATRRRQVTCAAIETMPAGARRLAGYEWDGRSWQTTWSQSAVGYRSLLLWDSDGDGGRQLLAQYP